MVRLVWVLVLLFQVLPAVAQNMPATAPAPKGELNKYTFDQSTIFPGTTRDYWIYIPRQYDAGRPACLYVNQDGLQWHAPEVFDQLIAAGEMPITIGVFVTPGRVTARSSEALDRFNRSVEYDGLGDAYAHFLIDELLPEVQKKTAADGRPIRLSANPNDRAIGGSSSGAICAFTAAWERPDSFSRVFSAIGTYVGLRGGNEYPTLVRKFEPKPLRIFLQDGSADQNIYGGDWWMANQEMERALTFAGYEVNHDWGTGGHNGVHGARVFPDAMRWLWKDWPAPIKVGQGSPQLRDLLLPGEGWQLVAGGYGLPAGPAANAKGEVFFNDSPGGRTYKIGLDGQISLWIAASGHVVGQTFGPAGRLYAAAEGAGQIIAYGPAADLSVIADGLKARDLVVRPDGSLYAIEPDDTGNASKVWFIDHKGQKKIVDTSPEYSGGVTLSPDQSLLYVDDMRSRWVYSYRIEADGSLSDKQRYYHLHVPDTADDSGAAGMCVDRDGRLYVATRMGVQICDQAGRVNCIIPTPNGNADNLCFGGPDFQTLFATCGDKIFKRKLKVSGVLSFQPPFKPAPPHL
jgi:gluconolactonase